MQVKISKEYLSKRKLFIATPMYGGNCTGVYSKSLTDLCILCSTHFGFVPQLYMLFNESLIPRARNYAADEFMRSGADHFLFLDADIGFDPQDIIVMMSMQTDDSPYDVLGAPYAKKCISWEKIVQAVNKGFADENANNLEKYVGDFVFNPKNGTQQIQLSEPCEVLEIGTGFMMIRRSAMEKFKEGYPEYSYRPDHVRTEHFDGSRPIWQYFQAEIDQVDFKKFFETEIKRISDLPAEVMKEELLSLDSKLTEEQKKYSRRYLSEDYWFCCPQNAMIETSEGHKSIKWIVDNKFNGNVKTLDESGSFSWKPVVNHIVRRNGKRGQPETKKKWVKLNTIRDNNTKSKLIVTEDHRIAYFSNILDPKVDYTEAKNMTGKYSIRNPQRTENELYSKDQLQFLYGSLLGDGYINKNGQLLITHSNDQEDYINLKAKIFNGKVNNGLQSKKGFKEGTCLNLHSSVNEQLHYLRELFYENEKKTVKNILSLLDEKSLAFWYMDDGSLNNGFDARIATESFSYDDHLLIQEWFKNRWNIDVIISDKFVEYKGEKRKYNTLRMNKENSGKFFNLIEAYVIPSMRYKLPSDWVILNSYNFDNVKSLEFSASFIEEVKYLPNHSSKLYDIEVEGNHNFFANGSLIHNCQKLNKIGGRIWLCPWMKTTHMGSMNFSGSLVDLAQIGASPTADPSLLKKNKEKQQLITKS